MREVCVAAAQLGPVSKTEGREAVVERMVSLLDDGSRRGAELVVYPELALTTFFPRWYFEDIAETDQWFERDMPNAATAPLFERAKQHGIAISFGYAELTPEGRRFNTSLLTDRCGEIIGVYRKIHLPGHAEFDPERAFQHLEKRYFEPGDLGFPVFASEGGLYGMCICNDRRWPETWRVLGLQGVEMVLIGFNTPSGNSQRPEEGPEERVFHHRLSVQAGAYQNATWAVAAAKAGMEDGHAMIGAGATMIVAPDGHVVAEAITDEDELVLYSCDLDATRFGKETMFDFARHRQPAQYGLITSQTGVSRPAAQ